jgi:hypothetical protein
MSDASLTFDMSSPGDFLEKLKCELEAVDEDLTSARHAINAALTAWHLPEWVWGRVVKKDYELRNSLGSDVARGGFEDFRDFVLEECPEMKTMRDIATGSKHLGTDGADVAETAQHNGAFSDEFSRAFDISRLEVTNTDGVTTYFDQVLEKVVRYWDGFFDDHLRDGFDT